MSRQGGRHRRRVRAGCGLQDQRYAGAAGVVVPQRDRLGHVEEALIHPLRADESGGAGDSWAARLLTRPSAAPTAASSSRLPSPRPTRWCVPDSPWVVPVPIGEGLPALLAAFETAPPVPAHDERHRAGDARQRNHGQGGTSTGM